MILIAGGTGRLGTRIANRLASRGIKVRVLARRPERARLPPDTEIVTGDVRDPRCLGPAFAGIDMVVSAVHGFSGPGGITPASVDRDGNANLAHAAKAHSAGLILMSIVGAAADSPMELCRMKHAAERYAVASGIPLTIVRATAFLELWIDLLRQTAARSGRPLVFGHGDNPINFVSVTDVAALISEVVTDPIAAGSTFEIGGPGNVTLNQLAAAVQTADGRTKPPRHISPRMLKALAGTVGRANPQLGRQARAALVMDSIDLSFDATPVRQRYPGLSCTSVTDVLEGHS